MRHFIANIATYTIALFLLTAAALFGWMRSAQLVVTDEETRLAPYAPGPEEFEWAELGEWSYFRNCANCHGADGRGWDQYPGLYYTGLLLTVPGGREYLVDLHLYGLTSDRWGAPMPPMGHMHDIEVAAVINYVLTRFAQKVDIAESELFTPQDIAERRLRDLSPRQVNAYRPELPFPSPP